MLSILALFTMFLKCTGSNTVFVRIIFHGSLSPILFKKNELAFIFYLPVTLNVISSPLSCLTIIKKLWMHGN